MTNAVHIYRGMIEPLRQELEDLRADYGDQKKILDNQGIAIAELKDGIYILTDQIREAGITPRWILEDIGRR